MMKKLIKLTLLVAVLLLPTSALAAIFYQDGIYYTTNGNEATVDRSDASGYVTIPATVNNNGTTYTVTAIGNYAFSGCDAITGISIPNTVLTIGNQAFYNCTGLTEVTMSNSVTSIGNSAFYNCSALTSISIPSTVTSIGSQAFDKCSGLSRVDITDIAAWCNISFASNAANPLYNAHHLYLNGGLVTDLAIPNSVTAISNYAFNGCSDLTSLTIPSSISTIGSYAFWGCVGLTNLVIPSSISTIGSSAFKGCVGLTNLVIPGSVTAINKYAFAGCDELSSIMVESNNQVYDSRNNCNAIIETATNTLIVGCKQTTIPNTVTTIGNSAFYDCTGLTSIVIPNSVTTIDYSAFYGCTNLSDISIPSSVTAIGASAFENTAWFNNQPDDLLYIGAIAYRYKGTMPEGTSITIKNGTLSLADFVFDNCTGLTNVSIPNSVTYIGNNAFNQCSSLTSVNIPNSVTTLAGEAFANCSSLTRVVIPNSITTINDGLFWACSSLTTVTLPNTITSIGSYAFYDCSGLTSITIPNSVATIGKYAFNRCSGLTSMVIPNSVTAISELTFRGCSSMTSITIPNTVTSIGRLAFWQCSSLTSIIIPSKVTSIGNQAFLDCLALKSVYCHIPDPNLVSMGIDVFALNNEDYSGRTLYVPLNKEYAYQNDSNWAPYFTSIRGKHYADFEVDGIYYDIRGNEAIVTSGDNPYTGEVSIPPTVTIDGTEYTVTSIGEKAFFNCSELTSVSIPNTITSIGSYAFAYCYGLERVNITDIASWCNIDFVNSKGEFNPLQCAHHLYLNGIEVTDLIVPESVTYINDYAFLGCTGLNSVVIPNSVTALGRESFKETGITSVVIPGSVKTIGYKAFMGCENLTDVTLSEGLTLIDEEAFSTSGITEIHLPESLVRIGEQAFEFTPLTSITIPKNVAYLGNEEEDENDLYGGVFDECHQLMDVNVDPANATYASYNGMLMTKDMKTFLYYPSGRTGQCVIPNSVTTIGGGWGGFSYSQGLTSVIIPKSVEYINDYAFYECNALTLVRIFAFTPPSVGYYPFSDFVGRYSNITLEVPAESLEAYRNHYYWRLFPNIQPIVQTPGDVDGDGRVGISDASDLIDLLLRGNVSLEDYPAADADGNGTINIADVSELIDMLLSMSNH